MNYIELLNQFWQVRRARGMSAYEADLYYYLLNECNRRMWLNPFELPTSIICAEIGISRKALIDLRNRLSQRGLIRFKEGCRNKRAAIYELLYVTVSNIQGNILGNIQGNVNGNTEGNELGNPIKNKLNKNKTKQEGKHPPATNSSFVGNDEDKSEEQPESVSRQTFVKPTVEEVEAYCKERRNSISAQKFVSYYQSNGWRVGRNPMKDWRAAIHAWEQNEFTDSKGKHDPLDPRFLGMLKVDMSDF